ncbi:hypothetical protein NUW58_g5418 [Xylaria curta]|uniref:Uncharacterized protein n=1 Tax=Xylaria curta TaxID=42375 RepID=A0ACC1P453_9PEZI|nr:hypothetical protein NUW58_g5418 [Xylaria curta]
MSHTFRIGWDRDDWEDDRRLASDPTVTLPGEPRRHTPRLERQEAFRVPEAWDISDTDVVADDAALYRLGILYDDDGENEVVRGSGFCLDAITRAEPVYSLRPAKRAKRAHNRRFPLIEEDLHLSVELLSTYLGDDAAIARFFAPVSEEKPTRAHGGGSDAINRKYNGSTLRKTSPEPLSIIYELVESSIHSPVATPAEDEFPGLISDIEDEGCGDHGEEDIVSNSDWALVLDPGSDAGQFSGDAAWADSDADVITDDEETANPIDGTWVFLAGDDS